MKIAFRSLRFRLALLYVVIMLTSMAMLGLFSYWYVGRVLASSRYETMMLREQRLITFVHNWPAYDTTSTLAAKLRQLSIAVAQTDDIQVDDMQGRLIFSSPSQHIYKVGWVGNGCFTPCLTVVQRGGHAIRVLNHVITLDHQQVRLSLTGMTDEHYDIQRRIRDSYLICVPLLLLASLTGGILMSHRALRPVHRMTNEASTIGLHDLKQRVLVPDTGDELQLLAQSWNDLLARLEIAVNRLTQFTSDISHDLRTTVTVMLTTAEFALRRQRTDNSYREALETIARECHTTSRLLDDLLAASRADIVQRNVESLPVNISEVICEACEHLRAIAETRHHQLILRIEEDAWTRGDLSMLRRLINILLDNAIKYTTNPGTILVTLEKQTSHLTLSVSDTGIGIPANALSNIFDRSYRVDEARNREDGSSGLGLSIAKWIADAHDATIQVSSVLGVGTTFAVMIPAHEHLFSAELPATRTVAI